MVGDNNRHLENALASLRSIYEAAQKDPKIFGEKTPETLKLLKELIDEIALWPAENTELANEINEHKTKVNKLVEEAETIKHYQLLDALQSVFGTDIRIKRDKPENNK